MSSLLCCQPTPVLVRSRYTTVDRISELLGYNRDFIMDLIRQGKLVAYKKSTMANSVWLVKLTDVDVFLASLGG